MRWDEEGPSSWTPRWGTAMGPSPRGKGVVAVCHWWLCLLLAATIIAPTPSDMDPARTAHRLTGFGHGHRKGLDGSDTEGASTCDALRHCYWSRFF